MNVKLFFKNNIRIYSFNIVCIIFLMRKNFIVMYSEGVNLLIFYFEDFFYKVV